MKKYTDRSKSPFLVDKDNSTPKYGLPNEIHFCKKCVLSNQRPNSAIEFQHKADTNKKTINFDENGVCDACNTNSRKSKEIDWSVREKELMELCDKYRSTDGSYDCLVPGSGGKDSFYQSHILKYKYNMNPLTVTWAPHIYTDWGWKNFQSWIHSGFDNYLLTPNPRMHRLLTRLAVENLFHPFQPFMIGQKAFAPKMAEKFNIKLIFYGENEAEYGNPIKDGNSAVRDYSYFTSDDPDNIFLGGTSLQDLKESFGVTGVDLEPYLPIDPNKLIEKSIQTHYLGYYLPWHPQGAYYYAVEHGGFIPSPERTPGTYSKYNSIDDKIDDFHYYTTFIKFGIGRATYDSAQEIRNEEITRNEGIALIKKYDGEFPERFAEEIFHYLSLNEKEFPIASKMFEEPIVTREYFTNLTDSFRSPHLWTKNGSNWILKKSITNSI
ncbi:MAG: N-acetyl sugar amidotransferase [Candidatus Cloacimonetes bacterium]|nr:N-acetyl sugar amidotransferase [Candidatus Cloacimonadota bacterium]